MGIKTIAARVDLIEKEKAEVESALKRLLISKQAFHEGEFVFVCNIYINLVMFMNGHKWF